MARPRSAVSRYKHRKNIDHLKVREAVLYARVSTPEQEREGYSIPAQVKLLEDYATLNGIAIVSSHVDVETSRKSGRTAFGNMLRYLRRHPEVRIILVEKTDRLYRNLKDWATIDYLGVEVHFVKENVVMSDGCRSSEKFVHGIKVLMAKAYIDNLSEETHKGMIEKAQQGHWPSCAPIGYCNVRDGEGRNVIVVDPEAGPIVTRLFDWYATGLNSSKEVTVMARNAGMRYRRSGRPLGVSTVQARTMCIALRGPDRSQPPARIYARLRAMDALAFEELLLESFAMRGHKVVRSHRYTGDGGVDGQVVIGGQTWLIQAKRYASAIRPEHVEAFALLCRRRGMPGLFIHTGRTGGLSRNLIDRHQHIEFISGERLLALLTGGQLTFKGSGI